MDLVKILSDKYMKAELPEMNVGDTVRVLVRVKEGNRERTQAFEGTIIAKKHGGINETITVRRISYGVGCEKVFPVHSPSIVSVTTVRKGNVRRAKLYSATVSARPPRSKSVCNFFVTKKGSLWGFLFLCCQLGIKRCIISQYRLKSLNRITELHPNTANREGRRQWTRRKPQERIRRTKQRSRYHRRCRHAVRPTTGSSR